MVAADLSKYRRAIMMSSALGQVEAELKHNGDSSAPGNESYISIGYVGNYNACPAVSVRYDERVQFNA